MKLFEINHAMRTALNNVEVDLETGEILNAEELKAVEQAAAEKIESTALYVRELNAEAEALEAEIDRMAKRVKAIKRKGDYLKDLMLFGLRETGKIKTGRVTVSIRKTQAVRVDVNADLPEAFVTKKITVTPNKIAIKEALQAGGIVPGCFLEERESVQIR